MHYHYHYHLRHHITLNNTDDTSRRSDSENDMPTSNNEEVVGGLMVNSSGVNETSNESQPCQKDECVGTLLVHQTDVQELSGAGSPKIVRRMTERVVKAIEHIPDQCIDPEDDVLQWQCDV
jgi:hypothetical protein